MATTSCLSSVTRTAFAPRPMQALVHDSALALAPLTPHLSSTIQPVMVLSAAHDATANRSTKAANRGNSFLMIILFHSGRRPRLPTQGTTNCEQVTQNAYGGKVPSPEIGPSLQHFTNGYLWAVALGGGGSARFWPGSR